MTLVDSKNTRLESNKLILQFIQGRAVCERLKKSPSDTSDPSAGPGKLKA